jgi:hypothetical protein
MVVISTRCELFFPELFTHFTDDRCIHVNSLIKKMICTYQTLARLRKTGKSEKEKSKM